MANHAIRTYTHPDVFTLGAAEGWAEAETDPTRIDWPPRQAAAAIPFEVTGGQPVCPFALSSDVGEGRNLMGWWGENLMADALVTLTFGGMRGILLVKREDGLGWAAPGGRAEPGETGLLAAVRELKEETGLDPLGDPAIHIGVLRVLPARGVDDPRASRRAWAVTIPVHIDLGGVAELPAVTGLDDALQAEWAHADTYGDLRAYLAAAHDGSIFPAHQAMLREFLAGKS